MVARPGSTIDVKFRLNLMVSPQFVDLHFRLQNATIESEATGASVPIVRRKDLDVPGRP